MTNLTGLFLFATVYFIAVATPGPGVALVIARALGKGLQGLPWFVAGFVLADLVLMTLAVSGLAVLARQFEMAFTLVRYAGALYLCYLAWRIWHAPVAARDIDAVLVQESPLKAFLSSFALTLGNPKPIVFFLSIMPLAVDMKEITFSTYLELVIIVILVIAPVMAGISLLADRARRLFRSERALRNLNRGTAGAMAGAALMVATR
ncbi:MAG: LysE family translocator [Proteobacteria bacterium]|nr:LysE family translocator [Pseudomonadota bacterium]